MLYKVIKIDIIKLKSRPTLSKGPSKMHDCMGYRYGLKCECMCQWMVQKYLRELVKVYAILEGGGRSREWNKTR